MRERGGRMRVQAERRKKEPSHGSIHTSKTLRSYSMHK